MQISTRKEDFIVDTLALRDEMDELNEVFTDPKIVKVFHGAESDIVWLQQDFNIYVVNMFDTFHASKLLGEFSCAPACALLSVDRQTFRGTVWRRSSKCIVTSFPTSDTNWLTGEYGEKMPSSV